MLQEDEFLLTFCNGKLPACTELTFTAWALCACTRARLRGRGAELHKGPCEDHRTSGPSNKLSISKQVLSLSAPGSTDNWLAVLTTADN